MHKAKNILKGAVAGLAGGLVASFVMTEYQALVTKLSDDKGSSGSKAEPATVKAGEALSEAVLDHKLTRSEKKLTDPAVHYAMGGFSGMFYGIAAEAAPSSAIGAGLPFGTAVWAVADDIIVPALGLSKPVTAYPLSTHAYALSSHLIYGLTTDIVRRAVRKLLD